jgi:DNA methylase
MIARRVASLSGDFTPELPLASWAMPVIPGIPPTYTTDWGAAYVGDSLPLLRTIPAGSIDLVITSPPYALEFKKEYGNVAKGEYVAWLKPFGEEIKRILKPKGSFVLNIGGSYNQGVSGTIQRSFPLQRNGSPSVGKGLKTPLNMFGGLARPRFPKQTIATFSTNTAPT